jgi:pimeloyl-ACP methyl ester carboxylesterase
VESHLVSRATAERMVAILPRGALVELPDSGHDVLRDNPAALLTAVRSFLLGSPSKTT